MVSNTTLGIMFREGKTRGQSNNMSIVEGKDYTYLVDYGWAVLAKRNKRTGKVTYYSGWHGYSRTTSKHISESGILFSDYISKERLKLSDVA